MYIGILYIKILIYYWIMCIIVSMYYSIIVLSSTVLVLRQLVYRHSTSVNISNRHIMKRSPPSKMEWTPKKQLWLTLFSRAVSFFALHEMLFHTILFIFEQYQIRYGVVELGNYSGLLYGVDGSLSKYNIEIPVSQSLITSYIN